MELADAIRKRRAVRKYTDRPVDDETLDRILRLRGSAHRAAVASRRGASSWCRTPSICRGRGADHRRWRGVLRADACPEGRHRRGAREVGARLRRERDVHLPPGAGLRGGTAGAARLSGRLPGSYEDDLNLALVRLPEPDARHTQGRARDGLDHRLHPVGRRTSCARSSASRPRSIPRLWSRSATRRSSRRVSPRPSSATSARGTRWSTTTPTATPGSSGSVGRREGSSGGGGGAAARGPGSGRMTRKPR